MSRRNDLWVFEFSDTDRTGEVYVDPKIVGQLSEYLEFLTRPVLKSTYGDEVDVNILLAALDRGSLRIAYWALLKIHQEDFALAANLATIATALGGVVWFALKSAGAVSADGREPELQNPSAIERQAQSSELLGPANSIINVAIKSGAYRVTVDIPNCPSLILVGEHNHQATRIGSKAPSFESPSPFAGDLTEIEGPLRIVAGAAQSNLYWGKILVAGTRRTVVIHWPSERSAQAAKEEGKAYVVGQLEPIMLDGYTSLDRIPQALEKAYAQLTVKRRLVDDET